MLKDQTKIVPGTWGAGGKAESGKAMLGSPSLREGCGLENILVSLFYLDVLMPINCGNCFMNGQLSG